MTHREGTRKFSKHSNFWITLYKQSTINVAPVMELIKSLSIFTIFAYWVSSNITSEYRGPSRKELLSQSIIVFILFHFYDLNLFAIDNDKCVIVLMFSWSSYDIWLQRIDVSFECYLLLFHFPFMLVYLFGSSSHFHVIFSFRLN